MSTFIADSHVAQNVTRVSNLLRFIIRFLVSFVTIKSMAKTLAPKTKP